MATVAILGGGISGLSCAYYLKTLGKSKINYLFLLEKSPKFGGWIQTTKYADGAIFEHGPRSLRFHGKAGYNALALANELNLASEVLPITKKDPASENKLVLVKNQLHALPNGLRYLFRTIPPFSKPMYHCIVKDLTTKKTAEKDESVHDFMERRLGTEVADYVFDPMCRGIAGGDSREISVRSLIPLMFQSDQDHGSIIKGAIVNARKNSDPGNVRFSSLLYKASNESWKMWTLKSGLGHLVDTLACSIEDKHRANLHFNAECTKLTFKDNKACVTVDGEEIEVDHVFSSIPSFKLAPLLKSYTNLSNYLSSITNVTIAVVYLEYDGFVHKHNAFGYLTPSFEDSKLLGVVFDSCCFPDQNGISRTRITCMIGGKWFKDIFGNSELVTNEQILEIALSEVKRQLQISTEPVRHSVVLQTECIPNYVVGHYRKLELIEEEIKSRNLCLSVFGASYKNAGVPDCIYNSKTAVENYLESNP